jgi:hypothetical protein
MLWSIPYFFFQTESHYVAQADLKLTMYPMLALNVQSPVSDS